MLSEPESKPRHKTRAGGKSDTTSASSSAFLP